MDRKHNRRFCKNYIQSQLVKRLNEYFLADGIIFRNVYIQYIYVPDAEQYNFVLRQAPKYLEKKLDKIVMIDNAKAEKESKTILLEYEKLKYEEMSKLIQKYPEILNFLRLEKMSSQAQFIYYPVEYFWSYQDFINRMNTNDTSKKNINKPSEKTFENSGRFLDKTPP